MMIGGIALLPRWYWCPRRRRHRRGLARGGCGGLRRWLWDFKKYFRDGGLQPGDVTRHRVLTAGKFLKGFPHPCETLRYLLHLRRVE
jgi:hypothetical protein